MLFHPPFKRNIISLGVTTQRVQQKERVLVTHLQQSASCVSHKQCMTIMHWVAQLECKDSICLITFTSHKTQIRFYNIENAFDKSKIQPGLLTPAFLQNNFRSKVGTVIKESVCLLNATVNVTESGFCTSERSTDRFIKLKSSILNPT